MPKGSYWTHFSFFVLSSNNSSAIASSGTKLGNLYLMNPSSTPLSVAAMPHIPSPIRIYPIIPLSLCSAISKYSFGRYFARLNILHIEGFIFAVIDNYTYVYIYIYILYIYHTSLRSIRSAFSYMNKSEYACNMSLFNFELYIQYICNYISIIIYIISSKSDVNGTLKGNI